MSGITIGVGFAFIGSMLAQVILLLPPLAGLAWLSLLAACVCWLHRRTARIAALVALRPLGSAARSVWKAVPAALLLGMGLSGLVYSWTGPIRFPIPLPAGNPIEVYLGTFEGWLTFTLYAVLVGPMIEEFAFRGWVQRSVAQRFGALAGIGTSAFLFAAFHFWYSHPQALLVPLVLGATWGTAVHRTGSVWAGVVLHGAWNAMLMLIQRSGLDSAAVFRWSQPELGLPLAIGMITVGFGILAVVWRRRPTRSKPQHFVAN